MRQSDLPEESRQRLRQARIDFAGYYGAATPADAEVMDQLVLARLFHALLANEATPCANPAPAVAASRDIRAKDKTAWRFCFSPHEPLRVASTPSEP